MPISPVMYEPSGRFIGRVAIQLAAPLVSAGDLVPTFPFPQDDLTNLYRFEITSEHAVTLGYHPGDEVFIDTSSLGYWSAEDYDNHVVLVQTNYGPIIGRYHLLTEGPCLELLDGSRAVMIWTPEMEICGLVHWLLLWRQDCDGRSTFI